MIGSFLPKQGSASRRACELLDFCFAAFGAAEKLARRRSFPWQWTFGGFSWCVLSNQLLELGDTRSAIRPRPELSTKLSNRGLTSHDTIADRRSSDAEAGTDNGAHTTGAIRRLSRQQKASLFVAERPCCEQWFDRLPVQGGARWAYEKTVLQRATVKPRGAINAPPRVRVFGDFSIASVIEPRPPSLG
jgi:hypothetical protein